MANILNLKEFPSDVGGEKESIESGSSQPEAPESGPSRELIAAGSAIFPVLSAEAPLLAESVSWRADATPDALERRKEHILLGILGGAALVVAVWQGSWTLVFVALLSIVTWEVNHRVHRETEVTIASDGVMVNGHRHRYERLTSFAIQEMPNGDRHLSIATASMLAPAVRAPLGGQDHEQVRAVLSQYLVEEHHPIPISELFLKS